MEDEKIFSSLRKLTGKSKIILTRRGNKALKFTLKALRAAGRERLSIQDQGGWITYRQYGEELGFEVVEVKTDYGLIDIADLKPKLNNKAVLLINSMPGYFAYEDMKSVSDAAKEKGAIVVNDASGSLGSENARYGDIIFGSFGRWKPVDVGYGGFIATDGDYLGELGSVFDVKWKPILAEKLARIGERTRFIKSISKKVKNELRDFELIHPEHDGFNVIVRFRTAEEKESILNYCGKNNLECTMCPRYIRVNADAVCIEVKRNV